VAAGGSRRQATTNLIAGLVPRAVDVTDPDMARALYDRDRAMERRAAELAAQAVERGQVWVHRLGSPPADRAVRETWMQAVSTVATYRDRWGIGNDHRPLGPGSAAKTIEAVGHRRRAKAAVERALQVAGEATTAPVDPVTAGAAEAGRQRSGSRAVTGFLIAVALLMAWPAIAWVRRRRRPSWEQMSA